MMMLKVKKTVLLVKSISYIHKNKDSILIEFLLQNKGMIFVSEGYCLYF